MKLLKKMVAAMTVCASAAGCVTPSVGPLEPPGVSSQVRQEIHRLAIRGPSRPKVALTDNLDGKGAATGKTAMAAGLGWLGGSMEAAGQAGEGALLVLALGLVATPAVAAGGALYGAAASDTKEAIEEGNSTLATVLDFAPDLFRHALEERFDQSVPVSYEFTGDLSDGELAARGFDAVLDIQMDSLTSAPSRNQFHAYFSTFNRVELRVFGRPDLTRQRIFYRELASRSVSSWAKDGGREVLAGLDQSYEETASELLDYFFLDKSVLVQGMEPVSRGWTVGTIGGTRPMFVWNARDGRLAPQEQHTEYELLLFTGSKAPEQGVRTAGPRYVPPEPLEACRQYSWQVRAHYESFGQPVASDWSPVYRFKTPCKRRQRS